MLTDTFSRRLLDVVRPSTKYFHYIQYSIRVANVINDLTIEGHAIA